MKASFLFSREVNSACGVMPQRAGVKSEGFISEEPFVSFVALRWKVFQTQTVFIEGFQ